MFENQESRYTYAIERPEPPKKKRGSKLLALLLSCAIISGAAGGAVGYSISQMNGVSPAEQPAYTQEQTPYTDNISTVASTVSETELTMEQIFERCNPAVVAISTEMQTANWFGQYSPQAAAGSGFIFSSNGYVVTNYHVIDGATSIKVMLSDGKEYTAKLISGDSQSDIAVLKIEATGLKYLEFGSSNSMKVGNTVAAIGNPLGELANTLTCGVLSAKERSINIDGTPMIMLQTDASISPGNSGGPLLNTRGQVIGIVSAKSSGDGVEGLGFAIPSEIAKKIVDDLIDHGYVTGRPYLGISVQEVTANMARYYNMSEGLYVSEVESGSCADKAGIKNGDVIVSIGETKVLSLAQLKAEKQKYSAGDTVKIQVSRDGKTVTLSLTFDEDKSTVDSLPSQTTNPRNYAEGA